MPKPPLTSEVEALVTQPNPAVVASVRADGTPHSAATWYEWRDGRALLSMDQSRRRLQYIRANPSVSLTIFDVHDQYRNSRSSDEYPSCIATKGSATSTAWRSITSVRRIPTGKDRASVRSSTSSAGPSGTHTARLRAWRRWDLLALSELTRNLYPLCTHLS